MKVRKVYKVLYEHYNFKNFITKFMEVKAISKSVRMCPRKVRLVADAIRTLSIDQAFQVLEATQKRASLPIMKTLQSAIANAARNNDLDVKNLVISSVMVSEAQALKRFHPSSRGRVHPYKKKGSHIRIVLKEKVIKARSVAKAGKTAVAKALADEGGKK